MITMLTQDYVYEEKREFVRKLEEALLCLDDIRGIEYRASRSNYIELVRIDWHGAGDIHAYINVTANSLRQILNVVALTVKYGWPNWQVSTKKEDKLWEELGNEMDRKDND